MTDLTQALVRSLFDYDEGTGIITRKYGEYNRD